MSTLSKLIKRFRVGADDKVPNPYFWDDDIATDFFIEALTEAVLRGHQIIDDTADFCTIELVDGQNAYPLDPRILDVEDDGCFMQFIEPVGSNSHYQPLQRVSYRVIAYEPLRRPADGYPEAFALRASASPAGGHTLLLSRNPDITKYSHLKLVVSRLPLVEMAVPDLEADPVIDPVPELPVHMHNGLVLWALHCAFDTRDSDKGNAQKAKDYEQRFTDYFGERIPADVERKQLDHRATICQPDSTFRAYGSRLRRRAYRPFVSP